MQLVVTGSHLKSVFSRGANVAHERTLKAALKAAMLWEMVIQWYTILFFWDPGLYSRAYYCLGRCNQFILSWEPIHYRIQALLGTRTPTIIPHGKADLAQKWLTLPNSTLAGNHEYSTERLNDSYRSFILLCPTFWIEYIHIVYCILYINYNILIFEYAWLHDHHSLNLNQSVASLVAPSIFPPGSHLSRGALLCIGWHVCAGCAICRECGFMNWF